MLNQVVLVGRIVKIFDTISIEDKEQTQITIAVSRSFKNKDDEYDTDFIDCILWDGISKQTKEYCKKGDLIGIKGRVQSMNQIVAEKVTFLSSNVKKESEDE